MPQVGAGKYTYELIRDFLKLPAGETFGLVSRVAADAQDRIYVFQRKDPPVVVFDRDGKYLGAWALARSPIRTVSKLSAIPSTRPIAPNSVAKSFTLDGRPLLELGQRGVHSDTGQITNWRAERAAGPFNHPTEMIAHPNGDLYVTDGYRNARVHRFRGRFRISVKSGHKAGSNGSGCGLRGRGISSISRTYWPKRRMCSRI